MIFNPLSHLNLTTNAIIATLKENDNFIEVVKLYTCMSLLEHTKTRWLQIVKNSVSQQKVKMEINFLNFICFLALEGQYNNAGMLIYITDCVIHNGTFFGRI